MVLTQIVLVILLVIKVLSLQVVLVNFLKRQGLASEPVYCTRDKLLLDVLTKLIVELEALLNVRAGIFIVLILGGRLRWREEAEERLGWYCLLDNTGLLSV
jgi:hydrogenase-4 membrane subunit HyfE